MMHPASPAHKEERPVLWTPSPERAAASSMARFMRWLEVERGLRFDGYQPLWEWSVSDLEGFWEAIVGFFGLEITPWQAVLGCRDMPGAEWFPGAEVSFARHILRHADTRPGDLALVSHSETFGRQEISWGELAEQAARVAAALQRLGVGRGDRVVAILPNAPEAVVAFLATASLGAIWSLAAPDMGAVAVLDRFRQIAPKVLIAQDEYVLAGRWIDRRAVVAGIAEGLPDLAHRIMVSARGTAMEGWIAWPDLMHEPARAVAVAVPFMHPLWIVYSSGTTGNPKPIVHSHGGVLLECAKASLHMDIGPRDRFAWLTSSGWIMWNAQFYALMQGARVALFDGAPNSPDMLEVWRMVAREGLSFFGAGAAFLAACQKAGVRPGAELDLSALTGQGSTGSPLSPEAYEWVYREVKSDLWLAPISGGTDIAGAFVAGNPMLPVRAGEMQCRALGNAVRAFDENGQEVIGQVGELVCTAPLPSMPVFFWGDADGARYRESYFETWPGVWRHGDWIEITPEGGAVIYGRSDATINRHGLRLGSSEIYRAVEALDAVLDSLVVDLEYLGRDGFMPLFVVLAPGAVLDEALRSTIVERIRADVSPRFVPDAIHAVPEVPRTLSGKKLEVPVKRLLLGADPANVVNRDSMANPASFDWFIAYADARGRAGERA